MPTTKDTKRHAMPPYCDTLRLQSISGGCISGSSEYVTIASTNALDLQSRCVMVSRSLLLMADLRVLIRAVSSCCLGGRIMARFQLNRPICRCMASLAFQGPVEAK